MDFEHTKITRVQFNEKLKFYTAGKELLFFLLNTISLTQALTILLLQKIWKNKDLKKLIVNYVEYR